MRLLRPAPRGLSRPVTLFCGTCVALVLGLSGSSSAAVAERASAAPAPLASVIVRELPGSGSRPERLVGELGGKVGRHIGIIDGFAAELPSAAIPRLETARGVRSVTPNAKVRLLNDLDGWDQMSDLGSLHYVGQEVTGAGEYWNNGLAGRGVDVALIDSGVVAVDGLRTPGKIVYGPDLSFESQASNLRHLDTYGHGTHMAGIIAGRDDAVPSQVQKGEENFVGIAPDARIVSVKVADAHGATDVSQVIAAIDWVVQHRRSNGLNIRVLNLSFGTDGEQSYQLDPLAHAAEVAWRKGIVVVVSAGNGGYGSDKLNNPAYDPFLIAVGAADGLGTYDYKDDVVQPWSSAAGDHERHPDLVAPGKSIASLRVPGSNLDLQHPNARVGDTPRFFRGSGTSQAAAVVSGAAALIIQQRPSITPNQVKKLLTQTASKLKDADVAAQGAGMIDLKLARDTATPSSTRSAQSFPRSTGTGSLELSRGSAHLVSRGVVLEGEQDIFGAPFNSGQHATAASSATAWNAGVWNGNTWTGSGWDGFQWDGFQWDGFQWDGFQWDGFQWDGFQWDGFQWDGFQWDGFQWDGFQWDGFQWDAANWGE